MNSYTLSRTSSPTLEITPAEMAEIVKRAREGGITVIWDRAGELRTIPTEVLGNAEDTYRQHLMMLRHRRIKAVPPVYIQLGQTIGPEKPAPVEVAVESAPMKLRSGPPPYRPKHASGDSGVDAPA